MNIEKLIRSTMRAMGWQEDEIGVANTLRVGIKAALELSTDNSDLEDVARVLTKYNKDD